LKIIIIFALKGKKIITINFTYDEENSNG